MDAELSSDTWVQQGLLRFNSARRSDIGEYRCTARNAYGEDSRILNVYVRGEQVPHPPQPSHQLVIQPADFTGRPGDRVLLLCTDRANPHAAVKWQKDGRSGPVYNAIINNGELIIPRASSDDSGRYICISSDNPSVSQTVDVHISSGDGHIRPEPPRIKKFNDFVQRHSRHRFLAGL